MRKYLIYLLLKCCITIVVVFFGYWGYTSIYPFSPAAPKVTQYTEIKTKQQAIDFMLTKFSIVELLRFKKMAQDGLTSKEKDTIKRILKSRLTDEEYNTIRVFVLNRMGK